MSYVMVAAAAVGIAKSQFVDKPKEDRQRHLAAETQRYSPWTGMKAGDIQEADPVGSALAFGAAGKQIQTGLQQQDINKQMADRASQPNTNYNPYGNQGASWNPGNSPSKYSVWGSMNMGG